MAEQRRIFLRQAPQADPTTPETVSRFLHENEDPNVRIRPDDVVRSAVADGGMYYLEDEDRRLCGVTGFYRFGNFPQQWAEIGTTLFSRDIRGIGLQVPLYQHIIAQKKLQDWPQRSLIAVVDESAVASFTNIEKCEFVRMEYVPTDLASVAGERDWSKIANRKKRLYRLQRNGLVSALRFVAANGRSHLLVNKKGDKRFVLDVEFAYLRQPEACAELSRIADLVAEDRESE